MKRDAVLTALVWSLLAPGCGAPGERPSVLIREDLRRGLLEMVKVDQAVRMRLMGEGPSEAVVAEGREVDRENSARLKEIVAALGWPGKSLAGADGADAAWLLVQHADRDREFQKQCLVLLEEAAAKGEAAPRHVAYLKDRLLVAEGRKQIYGTQFTTVNGEPVPQPIEDEAGVDSRRAQVGLPPMEEYRKLMRELLSGGRIPDGGASKP